MNRNPSPATRFRPGVSGNPSGRPKGVSLATSIQRVLTEEDAERIVRAMIRRAKKGDVRAFEALAARIDGPAIRQPDMRSPETDDRFSALILGDSAIRELAQSLFAAIGARGAGGTSLVRKRAELSAGAAPDAGETGGFEDRAGDPGRSWT